MDRAKAAKCREDIDIKINEIEQNRKEAFIVHTIKNEDSNDDEGKIRHSLYTEQQIIQLTNISETKVFDF